MANWQWALNKMTHEGAKVTRPGLAYDYVSLPANQVYHKQPYLCHDDRCNRYFIFSDKNGKVKKDCWAPNSDDINSEGWVEV